MAANKTKYYKLSFTEKIIYGIIFSILYILSLMPLRLLYVISDGLYLLVYKCVGYRKRLVRKNLTESFPEKGEEEIARIEKGFYHFLADYAVETIKLMSISKKEMEKRVTFHNLEVIKDAAERGQSTSAYIGHYCNWEWITSIGLHLQDTRIDIAQVYHILESRVSDKLFLYIRSRMGTTCVPMKEILRKRITCHKEGMPIVTGYISDQVPEWNSIHHWTDFLNHYTPVITGTETITKRFGDQAIYFDLSRPRRGYYNIDIKVIAKDTKDIPDWELTDKYFVELENTIRRQPELWLWSHNRWKRTIEGYERWKNGGGDDFGKKNRMLK